MKQVDFTQPYIQSSLMMVVPFHYVGVGQLWSFLKPFGPKLWVSIAALFVTTAVTIFILENEQPLFQQQPQVEDWTTRIANIFWFMSLTLVFWQRKDHEISTSLGRLLMVFWLLVVLIFTSTYTASLASILSAQQPSPTIQNFEDLRRSGQPVGCQEGSFTEGYIQNSLHISPSRLVKLANESEYVTALELGPNKKGGVAAILEESPYVQSFLNSECKYTTCGNEIAYFGGFAFAFQKNSNLTDDFSLAIISLSTNRELYNLKENYLGSGKCIKPNVGTVIPIQNFGGLFIVIGVLYGFCILFKILGWIRASSNTRKLSTRSLGQVSPGEAPEIAHVSPDHELKMGQVSPYHEVEMGHVRHDMGQVSPYHEVEMGHDEAEMHPA